VGGIVDATPVNITSSVTVSSASCLYAACQRASAARRAISRRRLGLSFSALARPPFSPPSLPSAIACGFFRRVMTQGGAKELPRGFLNKNARLGDSAPASSRVNVLDRVRNARRAPLTPGFRYVAANGCVGRTDTSPHRTGLEFTGMRQRVDHLTSQETKDTVSSDARRHNRSTLRPEHTRRMQSC